MGVAVLVATFAASYVVGPGTALQCAQVLGSPFSFIASHISQSWIVPHLTGLVLPELEETSPELMQSQGIVKDSCHRNTRYFQQIRAKPMLLKDLELCWIYST